MVIPLVISVHVPQHAQDSLIQIQTQTQIQNVFIKTLFFFFTYT